MVAFFYILSSTASFEMYLGVGQDMDTEIYCSKNESNTKKTHQISGKEKNPADIYTAVDTLTRKE